MASMKLEEQLNEQPPKKKPRIDNCQEEGANASNPKDHELPKSSLPSSHPHYRKLPAELNCQIFYCFNLATRRKFICGLGLGFYGMFRQILLKKSKQLRKAEGNKWSRSNAEGNAWRSNAEIIISDGGLNASNNTNGWQTVYAETEFPISVADCRIDDFPGTICYYFEVKILKPGIGIEYAFVVGLTNREIPLGGLIGLSPNSYNIGIPIPNGNFYQFRIAGQRHNFEFPEGVIRPVLKETGNVCGCGILVDPDDKVTIFFTLNGILIDRQIPIDPMVDHLFLTVSLWDGMSVEANFGHNSAKPFEYDIKKCPGMGLEWI